MNDTQKLIIAFCRLPNGDLVFIPGQYKTIAYPKTVYDPLIISDEQMIQWGKEAMESGVVDGC